MGLGLKEGGFFMRDHYAVALQLDSTFHIILGLAPKATFFSPRCGLLVKGLLAPGCIFYSRMGNVDEGLRCRRNCQHVLVAMDEVIEWAVLY
jgi:hypothetical protein